jgi:hypothetical protein
MIINIMDETGKNKVSEVRSSNKQQATSNKQQATSKGSTALR